MSEMTAAVLLLGGAGLFLGLVIAAAARLFRVKGDPRVELLTELLPGANCGGCGRAGCADLARAMAANEAKPSDCPVSSAEAVSAMARVLGVEVGRAERKVAVVRCNGDAFQMKIPVNYNGVLDCATAALVGGGPKGCSAGCLGLASCARACPFGAIEMIQHLAVVHPELCVGCGKCVAACPRGVIALVPADRSVQVYCNSKVKAPQKRKFCASPCLGCGKCARAFPEQFALADNLAAATGPGADAGTVETVQCPTRCLRTAAGHLAQEHREANA